MLKRLFLLFVFASVNACAAISVLDDVGNTVTLPRPAQRIITLAPHTMELVYVAGGLSRVVGKGSHSLYPPTARHIPEIGDNRQIDIERVIALRPDLLVLWRYGISERQIEQLRKLGIPLFFSDPRHLDNIADSIVRLGKLFGTEKQAYEEASKMRRTLDDLRLRYGQRPLLSVFYQVSDRPLYTLSGQHIISEALRICGGANVFASMKSLAPQISVESVLAANPDVIIHTSVDAGSDGLAAWRKYPSLKAVQRGHLYSLNPDLLDRPGPRMADGVKTLCETLDKAR
jgi:iron complex transport system substrate-binding protein